MASGNISTASPRKQTKVSSNVFGFNDPKCKQKRAEKFMSVPIPITAQVMGHYKSEDGNIKEVASSPHEMKEVSEAIATLVKSGICNVCMEQLTNNFEIDLYFVPWPQKGFHHACWPYKAILARPTIYLCLTWTYWKPVC
jgi:hypothetical protein